MSDTPSPTPFSDPPELTDAFRTHLKTLAERLYAARRTAVESGHEIDQDNAEPLCDREEDVVVEFESYGLTHIGTGAGRIVAAIDDEYVVKFARYGEADHTDGIRQNSHEDAVYAEYGDDHLLVPLLDSDESDYWVLMPRIDALAESPSIDTFGHMSELNQLLESLFPLAEVLHTPEVNPENVAFYEGELHLFDYGRPPVPLDEL